MEFTTTPSGKPLWIVENHHEVLIPYLRERQQLTAPPNICCLDHHTDTLPMFSHLSPAERSPFSPQPPLSENALLIALPLLHHDEHFDYALHAQLIHALTLFSHTHAPIIAHPAMQVICPESTPPFPQFPEEHSAYREYADTILTDTFLEARLNQLPPDFWQNGYILDLDLDYFHTYAALHRAGRLFRELARGAAAITIAKESIWVRLLALPDTSPIDADGILQRLLPLLP